MASPRKFSEKIALINQKQAEETAAFEKIMREVSDVTSRTVINNLEEIQQNPGYRNNERGRSMGVGPMRSKPIERRHDTSPYSGVPYLSPPLPETWRRTNSDSALHQSSNDACQGNSQHPHHRRGSDNTYQQRGHSSDNRDSHHSNFLERPRSSCEMPRVPGINVYSSPQPPGQQIPIGNNTGSLPDLSNVHFPSPIHNPIDQDDHSSGGSPYSNVSFNNHLSVPVPCRYLQSCKQGMGMESNTSQGDVRISFSPQAQSQPQQPQLSTSPLSGSPILQQQQNVPIANAPQYVYAPPLSPVAPHSPNSQPQIQANTGHFNALGSYRTAQMVNRPSPQSSPSLTVQGSPLSFSNNPSAPSSPTGHVGPPLNMDSQNSNYYVDHIDQVHDEFAQFNMMDPVSPTNVGYNMGTSPNHVSFQQNDVMSAANDLNTSDPSFLNINHLQQLPYHRIPASLQQLTAQTPNTPTITLTDCSLPDDLPNADLADEITDPFGPDLFGSDDALSQELSAFNDINSIRQDLSPLDLDELQRLANTDMVISDSNTEDHFKLHSQE